MPGQIVPWPEKTKASLGCAGTKPKGSVIDLNIPLTIPASSFAAASVALVATTAARNAK